MFFLNVTSGFELACGEISLIKHHGNSVQECDLSVLMDVFELGAVSPQSPQGWDGEKSRAHRAAAEQQGWRSPSAFSCVADKCKTGICQKNLLA